MEQGGDEFVILERRKNVAKRYIRGETQWEIARAFEVDQGTISRDLDAIRKLWIEEAVRDMDEIKAKELAKIDTVEAEAWKAWTKSQENAEVMRAKRRGIGSGSEERVTSETEKVTKGQAGDPRYLELVLKCVEKRCQILGVYDAVFARQLEELRRQIEELENEDADGTDTGEGGVPAIQGAGGPHSSPQEGQVNGNGPEPLQG